MNKIVNLKYIKKNWNRKICKYIYLILWLFIDHKLYVNK